MAQQSDVARSLALALALSLWLLLCGVAIRWCERQTALTPSCPSAVHPLAFLLRLRAQWAFQQAILGAEPGP